METLTFHLEEFDGPLDLLLYLVSKNKMDLHNIPILELIEQYTSIIDGLGAQRMEAASEFIEMAARLVQMKSYLLLPRSEEAERMKEELTGELIEYSTCRKVAAQLGQMAAASFMAVRRPAEIELDSTYLRKHEPGLLPQAWFSLMGRSVRKKKLEPKQFEPLVAAPFVSVASRVVHLLKGLVGGKIRALRQMFRPEAGRSETVATFLAVLELVKAGRISIDENEQITLAHGRVRKTDEVQEWN